MDSHLEDSPSMFTSSKKQELEGLSERELLERLLEITCPSCEKADIQDAAETLSHDV